MIFFLFFFVGYRDGEGDRPGQPVEHDWEDLRRRQVRGPLRYHGEGEDRPSTPPVLNAVT